MGTEDIRILDGHLTVERPVVHKDDIDISLSDVDDVSLERSPDPSADSALVVTTKDGTAHLIRVANDDIDDVWVAVHEAWRSSTKEEVPQKESTTEE